MKRLLLVGFTPLALCSLACRQPPEISSPLPTKGQESQSVPNNVVEITIRGLRFEAPDEIPSGWVTLRMKNESPMTHFGLLERMPEGYGIKQHQEELVPVAQKAIDLLMKGDQEGAGAAMQEFPSWLQELVYLGGPGLAAGGQTAQSTVYLTPGTYVMECYVKTDGIMHIYNPVPGEHGMAHQFTVTSEASVGSEPTATADVYLSTEKGIEAPEVLPPGKQTIAVHFIDQNGEFLGHDLHIARLSEDTDLEQLDDWMDVGRPGGLQTPAPVAFLGGINEMAGGRKGYFTVSLEPGRYALISELHEPQSRGLLKILEVRATE